MAGAVGGISPAVLGVVQCIDVRDTVVVPQKPVDLRLGQPAVPVVDALGQKQVALPVRHQVAAVENQRRRVAACPGKRGHLAGNGIVVGTRSIVPVGSVDDTQHSADLVDPVRAVVPGPDGIEVEVQALVLARRHPGNTRRPADHPDFGPGGGRSGRDLLQHAGVAGPGHDHGLGRLVLRRQAQSGCGRRAIQHHRRGGLSLDFKLFSRSPVWKACGNTLARGQPRKRISRPIPSVTARACQTN